MLDSDTGALAFGEGRVRRACRRAHRSEVRRRHWGAGIGLETRWGVQCDAGCPEGALRQSPPMTAKSGSTFHAPFLSPASQSIYRSIDLSIYRSIDLSIFPCDRGARDGPEVHDRKGHDGPYVIRRCAYAAAAARQHTTAPTVSCHRIGNQSARPARPYIRRSNT